MSASDKDVLNFQICEYLLIKSQFDFFQNLIKQILMQMITKILFSNQTCDDLYTIEISLQFLRENISLWRSLIHSYTSIINNCFWTCLLKKIKSIQKNGQTTSASEIFRNIHVMRLPNLLILNEKLIIYSVYSYVIVMAFIRL